MRTLIAWSCAALTLLALPALAWQEEPQEPAPAGLQVTRAVACLEVKDREPVSIDSVFSNRVEQIYCFTHVEGASEPTEIQHVWIHEGEEMARVSLQVRSASWRTYSSKKMLPSWTGEWKVEVRDASGGLLKTVEFTLTEADTGAPAEKPSGEAQGEEGGSDSGGSD